jgi:hypothetical protein
MTGANGTEVDDSSLCSGQVVRDSKEIVLSSTKIQTRYVSSPMAITPSALPT